MVRLRAGVLLAMLVGLAGCSREFYRRWADRDAYYVVAEHNATGPWAVPPITIEPPPESRLHDPTLPDHPPMPPDDLAAHAYMHRAGTKLGYRRWEKDGVLDEVEDPGWRSALNLDPEGVLVLSPERAVELGILHSREYQTQLESLYLTALSLTLNRFEFDLQWFGANGTVYNHTGSGGFDGGESNTLTNSTNLGFTRAFTTGGQLFVNLANSFVWQYTGPNRETVSSSLAINFIQPLLRGAWRDVRMEGLTQAERDVLYAVRAFARFRKEFYLNVTTRGQGYLTLLLQVQSIRNLEANLEAQVQNLALHEALYIAGSVSTVQVDQVFLSVQQARLSLLQARLSLDNALDSYKFQLGLPPDLAVRLDDTLLAPFQLNDPELVTLQADLEKLLAEYRELDQAPPVDSLADGLRRLSAQTARLPHFLDEVADELRRWEEGLTGTEEEVRREKASLEALRTQLEELRHDQERLQQRIDRQAAQLAPARSAEDWELLQKQCRDEIALVSQLFVIQTQARVFLVRLRPFPFQEEQAIDIALANRLDLMNEKARVVDAWRQIRVAADALEPGLNVVVGANLSTDALAQGPLDFTSKANSYSVGLQFDGPLNRFAERNRYRGVLVNYQRQRRQWLASSDAISLSVRRGPRQLETGRLNFSTARQSLIAAARQVDAARERLLLAGGNESTGTLDILNALNSLLQAKNTLIGSWVSYETLRLQLLFELELLELDDRGLYDDAAIFSRAEPPLPAPQP